MFVDEEHKIESPQTSIIVELDELFKEIVSLFSHVMLKQLRKDFLADVMRQKKHDLIIAMTCVVVFQACFDCGRFA